MNGGDDRVGARYAAKLRALLRGHLGANDLDPVGSAGGAMAVVGDELWVYSAVAERALGRALTLATRHQPSRVHLVLDTPSGDDARRVAALAIAVSVWHVVDTHLEPTAPVALPTPPDPPRGTEVTQFVALLKAAGLDVIVEHGVIVGECRGLEVARLAVSPAGTVSLEVGVGRFDQEASALLHGTASPEVGLERAVRIVAEQRRADAAPHPLNRLARERWLRAKVIAQPELVGVGALVAISPPMARRNVKDAMPASAIAVGDGFAVLVVCTVGVDVEWIAVASDLVLREQPTEVVVVLPPADLLDVQRRLAPMLSVPVRFVALDGDWPRG